MIIVDFETYSPESIDVGSYKYASHPDCDIVIMAYKVDDMPTLLWTPQNGRECPGIFNIPETKVYAHNALFDYLIWHKVGVRKYGFPEIPLSNWVDTMALANRYAFPSALEKVGEVLNLPVKKDRRGKALIKKISTPHKYGGRPVLGTHYDHKDMLDFQEYAIADVETTYQLIRALPARELTPREQKYWELTQRINMAGLPIDIKSVERILSYIECYTEDLTTRVAQLTDGAVTAVTQVQKVVKWINKQGVECKDLRAATVDKLLKKDIPENVREMLQLRQTLGRSSTAKYRKLKEMEYNGRVYNNVRYYGALTGRWSGSGFQLQNLPRASVESPDIYIDAFNNFSYVDDPVNVAKALIRPMVAAPAGYQLIVSDYSAIENRLLAWVANDTEALQLFKDGQDQYIDMASFMYNKKPEDVTKAERLVGKIIILGCGYGMGAKRFIETADGWGVSLTEPEAKTAVDAYRQKYPKIKRLWYKLKDAAVAAIQHPGREYVYNGCSFNVVRDKSNRRWLVLTLNSKRKLFYCEPFVSDDDFGFVPGHFGVNPYSKKWSRLRLIPGRITENIIQALARDVMAQGLFNIQTAMPEVKLIGTVHDEAIGEIKEDWIDEWTLRDFNNYLCAMPSWASGLPLEAAGYIAKRYKKG